MLKLLLVVHLVHDLELREDVLPLLVRLFQGFDLGLLASFFLLQFFNLYSKKFDFLLFSLAASDCTFAILQALSGFFVVIWVFSVLENTSFVLNVLIQILKLLARQISARAQSVA